MNEPEGTPAPRQYRVLSFNADRPADLADWGFFPGREPDVARKAAENKHRELKGKDTVTVAIPEGYWRPVKRTVRVIEQETYEPWTAPTNTNPAPPKEAKPNAGS